MLRIITFIALALVAASTAPISRAETGESGPSRRSSRRPLTINAVPWGPGVAEIQSAKQRVDAAVSDQLKGTKYRRVAFEYLNDGRGQKSQASLPPTRFRAIYYNYSDDIAVFAEGDFAGRETISTRIGSANPGVSEEEIADAFAFVKRTQIFANMSSGGTRTELYEPMPPTTIVNGERLVNIGIRNFTTEENRIIGVSFKNNSVHEYDGNAPPTSAATPDACGIANSNQPPSSIGTGGQFTLTVNEAGQSSPLWEMIVIRPSSSSGAQFERSGLEVRDVKYRGKSVLKRGHVPVLNVRYTSGCGPFRDWQYSENHFQIPTTGVSFPGSTPGTSDFGFAVINSPGIATTSVETGNDTGNFRGVAIYTQDVGNGPEAVLVTEMSAGWYRYIMEWRFATDGTIRPRYGFASVADTCVCRERIHHVYWRFDFDVVNPTNKIYQMDRGRKFLKLIETESALFKDTQKTRSLLIQNANGDEAYQLMPGTNDGRVLDDLGTLIDSYGVGDFWLMRFKGTANAPDELDDPNTSTAANFAPWINSEGMVDQDLVVWYAAHQRRIDQASRPSEDAPDVITGNHIVGPTLRPIRW